MAEQNNPMSNSQTLVINKPDFDYITVEQTDGNASVVKFQLMNPSIMTGDVLVILDGSDVIFHGMIGRVEDGWATAADKQGSSLDVTFPSEIDI